MSRKKERQGNYLHDILEEKYKDYHEFYEKEMDRKKNDRTRIKKGN